MAKIGTTELLVILVIAFFAIGPERLPKAARTLGRALGKLKKEYTAAKNELFENTEDFKTIEDDLKSVKKSFRQAMTDAEHGVKKQKQEIQSKVNDKTTTAVKASAVSPVESFSESEAPAAASDNGHPETDASVNTEPETAEEVL